MNGLTRKIDSLGRVVIPKELRRSMGIKESDELEIEAVPAGILLSPRKAVCASCGSTRGLTTLGQLSICKFCLNQLLRQREESAKNGSEEIQDLSV